MTAASRCASISIRSIGRLPPMPMSRSGSIAARRVSRAALHSRGRSAARPKARRRCIIEPWRVTSRIKGDSDAAVLEQIEFQYGPDDRAIKLRGDAKLTFGSQPQLGRRAVLAATRSRPHAGAAGGDAAPAAGRHQGAGRQFLRRATAAVPGQARAQRRDAHARRRHAAARERRREERRRELGYREPRPARSRHHPGAAQRPLRRPAQGRRLHGAGQDRFRRSARLRGVADRSRRSAGDRRRLAAPERRRRARQRDRSRSIGSRPRSTA